MRTLFKGGTVVSGKGMKRADLLVEDGKVVRSGKNLKADTMKQGYFQILPGVYPCDGFFLSVMKRK